jgi:hypothetical protein
VAETGARGSERLDASTVRVEGVSLPEYAAVTAAVAEGFTEADVLQVEGIPSEEWARAAIPWKLKLADDAGVFAGYREELARAEDWLEREVSPIDREPRAWASFLGALEVDAAAALRTSRLRAPDLARLCRRWAREIEADAKLGKRLAELRKQREPLPLVTAVEAALRPSRVARATRPKEVSERVAPAPRIGRTVDLGLEIYAAIRAEIEANPHDLAERLSRFGITSPAARAALEARWEKEMARDPTLARDLRILVSHALQRRSKAQPSSGPSPASAPARGAMTSPPVVAPRSPPALAGTALALDPPRGPALPFAGGGSSAAPAQAGPTAPRPEVKRPPPALAGTSLALDLPKGPALPFVAGAAAPLATRSEPTSPGRPAPPLGGTLLAVEVPRAIASTFTHEDPVSMAWLTIEQHAALAAELDLAPGAEASILAQHHLTAEGKEALDRHYRIRRGAIPEVREAWERAYAARRGR